MTTTLEPPVLQGELMPNVAPVNEPAAPQSELAKIVQSNNLDFESARSLQAAFSAYFDQAEHWITTANAIRVTDVSQTREMKLAREARLALRDIRVNAEKTRKALKEDSLRRGKAIDGAANIIKFLIEPAEKHLEDQEKFAERKEAERKEKLLEERRNTLAPFCAWEDIANVRLADMTEEQWQMFYSGAEARYNERLEAARKAEQDRIEREQAEAAERERIRQENERLRAEAEAAEEARQAAEAERIVQERNAREQLQAAEAKAKAEREAQQKKAAKQLAAQKEKLRKEQEARAAAEKAAEQERQRLADIEAQRQREEQARADAEAARIAEEEAARKRAEAAPDKEKLCALVETQRDLPFPDLVTEPARELAVEYLRRHFELMQWFESAIAKL